MSQQGQTAEQIKAKVLLGQRATEQCMYLQTECSSDFPHWPLWNFSLSPNQRLQWGPKKKKKIMTT